MLCPAPSPCHRCTCFKQRGEPSRNEALRTSSYYFPLQEKKSPQQAPVSCTDSPTVALCWGLWNLEEVAMTQQKQHSTSGHLRAAPAPDSISHSRFPGKTSHPLPQTPSPRHLARPRLLRGDPLKPGLQYDFLSLCCCLFLSGILVTTYKI